MRNKIIVFLAIVGILFFNNSCGQNTTTKQSSSTKTKFFSPEDLAIYVFNCLKTANKSGYLKLYIPIEKKREEFLKIAELQPDNVSFLSWLNSDDHATKELFEAEFERKLFELSKSGINLNQASISDITVKYFDYKNNDKSSRVRVEINYKFNNSINKINMSKDIYRLSDGTWCISKPSL